MTAAGEKGPHSLGKAHRVSRLLEIVSLIQSGTGWTAKALSERFGVSRTRIFNDIRALRDAGVPVQRSPKGYQVDPSFFLSSVQLTPSEVLALLVPSQLFARTEAEREVLRSAREKLLTCLPEALRQEAGDLVRRTSIAVPTADVRGEVFEALRHAVAERRRVALDYEGRASRRQRLEVDPYGLAFRKHAWYLVAHSPKHGEVRKFRVSRIASVAPTRLHFPVPKDFSLEACFEGTWYVFGGEPQAIELWFSPEVARLVRDRLPHPGQRFQTLSDGAVLYRATVRNLDEVAWWLMQYGGGAKVLSPPELAQRVVRLAWETLQRYRLVKPRPYPPAAGVPGWMVAEGEAGGPGGEAPPPPRRT